MLVACHTLESLDGVDQIQPRLGVDYFHIATRRHEVIWAEDLSSETMLVSDRTAPWTQEPSAGAPAVFADADMTPARKILDNPSARLLAAMMRQPAGCLAA
ncbi:Hint domain-containing protein [Aestuariicoccus sp. MJ-SS9]|uniref:Hint domain-containing protein n=1 Tax=Aestuariicoccus sp. MJ-SS9 TaxID=3079855 RepID=UPI003977C7FE